MTSPLLIFSSSFSYYTVVVLTIFNHIHYENAIVGADKSNNLVFDSDSCLLKEPYYNYTFNLSLSTDLGRHVVGHSAKEQIDFNFCSSFDRKCGDKQNVHACLEKDGKKYVLGTSQKISYNNGRITFKYDGGEPCENGKNYQLFVDLGCDYTIDSQLFGFQNSNDSCFYYLKWEDSRACLPIPDKIHGECKITDKDFTFDFSPLGEFNYRVSDRNNSEFIINPCQPILYDFNATCPAGSSICYYSGNETLNERFINYGTANPNPTMEDNNPVIIYNSDIKCDETHNIKSKIYFHCDWKNEYGNPKFHHFSECTYHFVWLTSFACRRGEKEEDLPCILRDPSTGFLYNMTDLMNKYYDGELNGKKYSFAICESNDEKNGAYLLNDGKKESRGRISSILLRHKTGVPYLSYDSDVRCSDSMKWKTEIYFVCPENDSSQNKIKILNDTNCNLRINFETILACQYEISCNIPEYNIDLSSLINVTGYYVAKINDSFKDTIKSKEFLINVCRPIKRTKSEKCYDGSGACMVSLDVNSKDELSLGHPSHLTKPSDSEVVLNYYNGSTCPDSPNINLSSSIKFLCDHKVGRGLPILQSIIDKCHYEFNWATNVICPQHSVKFNVDTCEIINDVIDDKFNLKDAKFAGGNGKITAKGNGIDEVINLCDCKDTVATVDYSHSMVTLFFKLDKKCSGQDSSQILIQLNLICAPSENRTTIPVGNNCSLMINQNVPDICPFLGISTIINHNEKPKIVVPSTEMVTKPIETETTTKTTTTTTAKTTTPKPNIATTQKETEQSVTSTMPTKSVVESTTTTTAKPTNKTTTVTDEGTISSSGTMSASEITFTFLFCLALFVGGVLVLLRNENIRSKIRGVLTRNSNSGVQYSRVRHEDAANLLLQNVPNDSDDEMLL